MVEGAVGLPIEEFFARTEITFTPINVSSFSLP
jgi:hypothetical protein